ncbi:MAG: TetR/AcrR family transcriptional regulator [Solimonas sp.]
MNAPPKPTAKPPQKPRIRNPEQTRARLLHATIELLADKGADALSLKEVARVANVSRGVAYQHFEDRDHLLREAKAWVSDRLLESLVAANDPDSMEERVYNVTRMILRNREATRVLIADALAGKALQPDQPLYKLTVRSLAHMKASGRARQDIDVEILSVIMLGTIATIIMLSHLDNGDTDTLAQRFTGEWTRIMREGIFARGADRDVSARSRRKKS